MTSTPILGRIIGAPPLVWMVSAMLALIVGYGMLVWLILFSGRFHL